MFGQCILVHELNTKMYEILHPVNGNMLTRCLGPCQTSIMDFFEKAVNGQKFQNAFVKKLHHGFLMGSQIRLYKGLLKDLT